LKKIFRSLLAFSFVGVFLLITPAETSAAIAEQPCNQYSWTQEDDVAHQMSLPYSLPLGNTTYNTTYVTTNGTLTFGTPDPTFHTYPSTPSISLAGWDWVTWNGGYLSYGVTNTGFCVEWKVRPFPQSSGEFTTIKLTVDTSRLPTWSGIVETTGWLPADLRRGIRFQSNEAVVQISEAFTINGGRPVEMQTCWDGTIIPMSGTCPAEPPPGQCWDGSTVAYNETCPPVPPDTQCWDGTWVAWSQTCPPQPPPVTCWDGSVVPHNQTCPPTPPDIVCWNGSTIPWNQTCPQVPPPVECWNGTSVNWNEQCPIRTLNPPSNIIGEVRTDGVYISWDPPSDLFTSVERYAISWQCNGCAGYGWSSNSTSVLITFSTFGYTGGTGREYTFSVRADNDTTSTYSSNIVGPTLFVQEPTPSPEPQQSQSPQPTPEPTPTPIEPTPEPTEPISTPEPTPTPSETPDLPTPEEPLPTIAPEDPEPSPEPTPEPTIEPEPIIEPEPETDFTQQEVDNFVEDAVSDGAFTEAETETFIENLEADGEISAEEVSNLFDSLTEDGALLTQEDKELLADVLVAQADGEAITSDLIEELGLDYEDLPPEQPVALDNGVILIAEVADAIEIFEDPAELLSTVFTDPGKALKAVANIGADMTIETRKEAQAVTVSAVVVTQIISGTSALALARK